MTKKITVATSQFEVSANVGKNMSVIKRQIKSAADKNADVVHFSECCLSGYGGFDFEAYDPETEKQIRRGISEICLFAKSNKIQVVFGTYFFEEDQQKPYNSLFVINAEGDIVTRYDKRLLAEFDLDWYSAGRNPGVFEINGIKCGLLICHEWRYPELYRQYYHLGVEVLFQSWYDGNYTDDEYQNEGKNLGEVIQGFVRGNAANNRLWVSASNTSKSQSSFSAFVCRPNGSISGKLKRNTAEVLISEIDLDQEFIDLSSHLRNEVSRMKWF